jgi:hypothetical protein
LPIRAVFDPEVIVTLGLADDAVRHASSEENVRAIRDLTPTRRDRAQRHGTLAVGRIRSTRSSRPNRSSR